MVICCSFKRKTQYVAVQEKSAKKLEKTFKKVLTTVFRCAIMCKHSRESQAKIESKNIRKKV